MSYTVTKTPRSLVFYWTSGSFGTVTMSYKIGYKLMIFHDSNLNVYSPSGVSSI